MDIFVLSTNCIRKSCLSLSLREDLYARDFANTVPPFTAFSPVAKGFEIVRIVEGRRRLIVS